MIQEYAKDFIARFRDREPSAEEIREFAKAVLTDGRPQYHCDNCGRVLTARAMMRPCVHCGHKGNHAVYNEIILAKRNGVS